MKSTLSLIIIACSISIISSCHKEDAVENNSLIGKWLLIEMYTGYVNGGNFKWNTVPYQNAHSLEFTATGQYIRRENSGVTFPECTGSYHMQRDMTLEVNSTCENATMKISELTSKSLVIDYEVREGIVRYKYLAEK